jgi:hypothetical protein
MEILMGLSSILNSRRFRKIIVLILSIIPTQIIAQTQPATKTKTDLVYFVFNKSDLSADACSKLDLLCDFIKNVQINNISIIGHTDFKGGETYNLGLSKLRAETVRNYLTSKGIDSKLIDISYLGESKPIKTNETDEGRQKNRRTEIVIQYSEFPELVKIKEVKNDSSKNGKPEKFTFIGKGGTRVVIPDNFFEPYTPDQVDFSITEAFNSCQMISQGLTTMDNNGNCLQTAGMVFFNATYKAKKIEATGQQRMEVWIPTNTPGEKMGIYLPEKGLWKPIETELELREQDGKFYYVFETEMIDGCNIDRLVGPCPQNGPIVKTTMDKNQWVFLDYDGTTITKGIALDSKRHQLPNFSTTIKPKIVAISSTKYFTYIVNKPLDEIKYSHLRRKYILKKKDYVEHKKFDDKASLADYLCRK